MIIIRRSKYIDVWLYTEDIQDPNLKLNIDIGYISEDMNGDNILNSEDQAIFGNIGNNILDEGEDIGYDGCTDLYEDGNGTVYLLMKDHLQTYVIPLLIKIY